MASDSQITVVPAFLQWIFWASPTRFALLSLAREALSKPYPCSRETEHVQTLHDLYDVDFSGPTETDAMGRKHAGQELDYMYSYAGACPMDAMERLETLLGFGIRDPDWRVTLGGCADVTFAPWQILFFFYVPLAHMWAFCALRADTINRAAGSEVKEAKNWKWRLCALRQDFPLLLLLSLLIGVCVWSHEQFKRGDQYPVGSSQLMDGTIDERNLHPNLKNLRVGSSDLPV